MADGNKDLYSEIGVRINKTLEKRGETQLQLANALGYQNHQMVGYWISGKRKPTLEQLLEISRRYDVSMDYLTTRSEADTPVSESGKELQFVCDYTGLSPTAVESLINCKRGAPADMAFLSALISEYALSIAFRLSAIDETAKEILETDFDISGDTTLDEYGELAGTKERDLSLSEYRFLQLCNDITQKLTSVEKARAKLDAIVDGIFRSDSDGEHIETADN